MKHVTSGLVMMGALLVALPTHAQAVDLARITARMQEIITEMQALQAEFQTLQSSLGTVSVNTAANPAAGAVLGAATTALQEEAIYGSTNDTITRIQTLLATDPLIYPEGTVSGFFGPKTQAAIKNLQARFGMDPVGVVGPATAALLLEYFTAYPNGNYPANVLKSRPSARVLDAQTAAAQSPVVTNSAVSSASTGPIDRLTIREDDGEYFVTVYFTNGTKKLVVTYSDDEDEIIEAIAKRTTATRNEAAAAVAQLDLDTSSRDTERSQKRSRDDRDDADDALDDADDTIDDADDVITEAAADGEEVEYAKALLATAEDLLDDAEDAFDDGDYEEAIDLAEAAIEKADAARAAIGNSRSDAIKKIIATVSGSQTHVAVRYDDGEDEKFTLTMTDDNDVIAAVADRLDVRERAVEDVIRFAYADIDEIEAEIEDGYSYITVRFEDASTLTFTVFADEEDELIEKIADRLDLDEDEVEDVVDFQ